MVVTKVVMMAITLVVSTAAAVVAVLEITETVVADCRDGDTGL